jgi:hypothetical protein
MKELLFLITLSTSVMSQTQETEIIYTGKGEIITNKGVEIPEEITCSFVSSRKITFKQADGFVDKILVSDVKEWSVNDLHFVKIKTSALAVGNDDEIAILKTPEKQFETFL